MKVLLLLLTAAVASCANQVKPAPQDNGAVNEPTERVVPTNQGDQGDKWKADEATKKNVAAMVQVVNDRRYADTAKRKRLYAALQTNVDTLISQCRMQGAEHEALHVWLEKVLKDMKELKDEGNDYTKAYGYLKKDIERFNTLFE